MMRKPFSLGPLAPATHPIAFLLILCDELQEWNREAYGIKDKLRTLAAEARIEVTDERLAINVYYPQRFAARLFFARKEKAVV